MIILCSNTPRTRELLEKKGLKEMDMGSGSYFRIILNGMRFAEVKYPQESMNPLTIMDLTQESLDQMLLLHSLGMSNQEIIEVIKGEGDVLTST